MAGGTMRGKWETNFSLIQRRTSSIIKTITLSVSWPRSESLFHQLVFVKSLCVLISTSLKWSDESCPLSCYQIKTESSHIEILAVIVIYSINDDCFKIPFHKGMGLLRSK